MYIKIENFLANASFCILFLSMIFYWLEVSLFFPNPQLIIKSSSGVKLGLPVVKSGGRQIEDFRSPGLTTVKPNLTDKTPNNIFYQLSKQISELFTMKKLGMFGMVFSQFCLVTLLSLRWIESGHFPLSNLYESLMFLSWSFTFLFLLLENFTQNPLLGCIISPCALFTNAFASFSLPEEMQKSSALVPALQSNWLMMHVTVMILSYSALILGSLLSIAFLIITKATHLSSNNLQLSSLTVGEDSDNSPTTKIREPETFYSIPRNNKLLEFTQNLDNLSYRILGIGFPLLTIGILSGAVWANEAWGSYWSWDPKETWALLTWLVFAIYLHSRFNKGWQGEKPALIASLGFLTVWVCFLGVNLIGEGLHSYGWFNS